MDQARVSSMASWPPCSTMPRVGGSHRELARGSDFMPTGAGPGAPPGLGTVRGERLGHRGGGRRRVRTAGADAGRRRLHRSYACPPPSGTAAIPTARRRSAHSQPRTWCANTSTVQIAGFFERHGDAEGIGLPVAYMLMDYVSRGEAGPSCEGRGQGALARRLPGVHVEAMAEARRAQRAAAD